MRQRPLRPCLICGLPARGSRCPAHARPSRWPESDAYGSDWRKVRDRYIAEHPTCAWPGCGQPAEEVDHITPIRVDPSRRLDPTNLRSLCAHHHRGVTARASNGRRGGEVAGAALTTRDRKSVV